MDARGHLVPLKMISEAKKEATVTLTIPRRANSKCKQILLLKKIKSQDELLILSSIEPTLTEDLSCAGHPEPPLSDMQATEGHGGQSWALWKLPGTSLEAGDLLEKPTLSFDRGEN